MCLLINFVFFLFFYKSCEGEESITNSTSIRESVMPRTGDMSALLGLGPWASGGVALGPRALGPLGLGPLGLPWAAWALGGGAWALGGGAGALGLGRLGERLGEGLGGLGGPRGASASASGLGASCLASDTPS